MNQTPEFQNARPNVNVYIQIQLQHLLDAFPLGHLGLRYHLMRHFSHQEVEIVQELVNILRMQLLS